ncbi:MAG: hypothetical protein PHY02_01555 [Phycisphaerae bacterium]|nr:hypothetical protein [Phycisphaerae bacterium]
MVSEEKSECAKLKLDSYFYFTVCRDNYKQLKEYEQKVSLILTKESESLTSKLEAFKLQKEMAKYATSVVVFAVFSLEAWIYEYAVRKLSKSFFDNHIDKLRPASKWVIVTRLVTGRDFPTDSQAFEHLKNLYKARNDLVHPKPSAQPEDTKDSLEKEEKERELLIKNAHEAYRTCKEAILELDKVENNGKKSKWAKQFEAILFGDV